MLLMHFLKMLFLNPSQCGVHQHKGPRQTSASNTSRQSRPQSKHVESCVPQYMFRTHLGIQQEMPMDFFIWDVMDLDAPFNLHEVNEDDFDHEAEDVVSSSLRMPEDDVPHVGATQSVPIVDVVEAIIGGIPQSVLTHVAEKVKLGGIVPNIPYVNVIAEAMRGTDGKATPVDPMVDMAVDPAGGVTSVHAGWKPELCPSVVSLVDAMDQILVVMHQVLEVRAYACQALPVRVMCPITFTPRRPVWSNSTR